MARFTLEEAADKLGVSIKTIRRHIKKGNIYADMEDGRYYVPGTEVDRMATEVTQVDTKKMDRTGQLTTAVTISREEWDALQARLGYLEGKAQLFLEHKKSTEAKEIELEETRNQLSEMKRENRFLKMSFWLTISVLALGTFILGAFVYWLRP